MRGKFQIPIILHDNYFLYGKIVPPPQKLYILWQIVLAMASSSAMVTTYSVIAQQRSVRLIESEDGEQGFPCPVTQPTR